VTPGTPRFFIAALVLALLLLIGALLAGLSSLPPSSPDTTVLPLVTVTP
jgi:hypothetical protein